MTKTTWNRSVGVHRIHISPNQNNQGELIRIT